jgi:integrase
MPKLGQIIKREYGYLVRVYNGRDPVTGKKVYTNKPIHGTRKDAEGWLKAALRDQDLGTFVRPTKQTLMEFLNFWLDTVAKRRVQAHTWDYYNAQIRRYIKEPLASKALSSVTHTDLQALYGALLDTGRAASTVRLFHSLLANALRQAVKWRIIPQNPTQLVELPKLKRREMKVFTPEQAQRFVQACANEKHGLAFIFALMMGMRPSEYLALKWSDIDFEREVVTVQRKSVITRGHGAVIGPPKTDSSRRSLPLPKSLAEALRDHRRKQSEWRLGLGDSFKNDDYVFVARTGKPLRQDVMIDHFQRILRDVGLPKMRLYDLRHSCATLLLAADENVKVISERLGHSNIQITLDVYCHVLPHMQKRASDTMEELLTRKA